MPISLLYFTVYQHGVLVKSALYAPDTVNSGMHCVEQLAHNLGPGEYTVASSLYVSTKALKDMVFGSRAGFFSAFGPPVFSAIEGTVTVTPGNTST